MRAIALAILIIFFNSDLLSQDYVNGDFKPIFSSPDANIVFPMFKGGKAGLNQYLSDSVKIPTELSNIETSGTVILGYEINTKGEISKVKVDKKYSTMNEALHRLITSTLKKSSPWKTGIKNSKPFIAVLQVSFTFD